MNFTSRVLLISDPLSLSFCTQLQVQLLNKERSGMCLGKFFIMVFLLFIILLSRITVIKPYKNRDGIQKIKSSCIIIIIIIIINSWLIILNLLCNGNLEIYIFCRMERHVMVVEVLTCFLLLSYILCLLIQLIHEYGRYIIERNENIIFI